MSQSVDRFRIWNSSFGFYHPDIREGRHHARQDELPFDVIRMDKSLPQAELVEFIRQHGPFHGVLAGLQNFDEVVLQALLDGARGLGFDRFGIARDGVGFDEIDLLAAEKLGVGVAYTAGVNSIPVAERALMFMLMASQRALEQHGKLVQGEWRAVFGRQLHGRSLAILGFGFVGRRVANLAMAFGMKVRVYDPLWVPGDDWASGADEKCRHLRACHSDGSIERVSSVEEALVGADIVTLHWNSSLENFHLITDRTLALCKPGVTIINTARGEPVDTEAIVRALDSEHVYRYCADVFEGERKRPFTANPLCGRKDVILTPHTASWSLENRPEQSVLALDNLYGILTGGTVSAYIVRPATF